MSLVVVLISCLKSVLVFNHFVVDVIIVIFVPLLRKCTIMDNGVLLTVVGFLVIFAATSLGAAMVFFLRGAFSGRVNALMLGFAAGVMTAASVWSLLIPSIEGAADDFGIWAWVPAVIGFFVGGLFLMLLDHVVPHLHYGTEQEEGPKTHLHKSIKMFLAVTIHNIPEGLAVGFAFGAASVDGTAAAYAAALGLAVGIAIQNMPEGTAVSLPMLQVVKSRSKAFLFGVGSGIVEPIAALLGFFLASQLISLQPWLLAFAAGAMIFVVAEDLIPDAKMEENPHLGTWGFMAGFAVMMVLDVALG